MKFEWMFNSLSWHEVITHATPFKSRSCPQDALAGPTCAAVQFWLRYCLSLQHWLYRYTYHSRLVLFYVHCLDYTHIDTIIRNCMPSSISLPGLEHAVSLLTILKFMLHRFTVRKSEKPIDPGYHELRFIGPRGPRAKRHIVLLYIQLFLMFYSL